MAPHPPSHCLQGQVLHQLVFAGVYKTTSLPCPEALAAKDQIQRVADCLRSCKSAQSCRQAVLDSIAADAAVVAAAAEVGPLSSSMSGAEGNTTSGPTASTGSRQLYIWEQLAVDLVDCFSLDGVDTNSSSGSLVCTLINALRLQLLTELTNQLRAVAGAAALSQLYAAALPRVHSRLASKVSSDLLPELSYKKAHTLESRFYAMEKWLSTANNVDAAPIISEAMVEVLGSSFNSSSSDRLISLWQYSSSLSARSMMEQLMMPNFLQQILQESLFGWSLLSLQLPDIQAALQQRQLGARAQQTAEALMASGEELLTALSSHWQVSALTHSIVRVLSCYL